MPLENLDKVSTSNDIKKEIEGFNQKLLVNLPSLKYENILGDWARAILGILGLDSKMDPSALVQALAIERSKIMRANNSVFKKSDEKSS